MRPIEMYSKILLRTSFCWWPTEWLCTNCYYRAISKIVPGFCFVRSLFHSFGPFTQIHHELFFFLCGILFTGLTIREKKNKTKLMCIVYDSHSLAPYLAHIWRFDYFSPSFYFLNNINMGYTYKYLVWRVVSFNAFISSICSNNVQQLDCVNFQHYIRCVLIVVAVCCVASTFIFFLLLFTFHWFPFDVKLLEYLYMIYYIWKVSVFFFLHPKFPFFNRVRWIEQFCKFAHIARYRSLALFLSFVASLFLWCTHKNRLTKLFM